jgi:MoxR-like ATPase
MKPSQVNKAIRSAIIAKRPAFVWGPPGVGKSAVVRQTADELSMRFLDVRAVLLDPVDLRGMPSIQDGRTYWCPPAFLPHDDTPTLLFLDELPQAPPMVMNACSSLILDRRLGEYILPDTVSIIAAGNRETDRAATNRLPSHVANRFSPHIEFEPELDDWCNWALGNDIAPEIVAFVRFRPNLLHSFDPARMTEKAFPAPRSWEFVSDLSKTGLDPEIEYDIIAGTVGQGAAAEYVSFLRIWRELPSPDAVILNPQTADVPSEPATLYALCGALSRKCTEQSIDRIVAYADRLPPEFGVLLIKDAIRLCPKAASTSAFVGWSSRNSDVLI